MRSEQHPQTAPASPRHVWIVNHHALIPSKDGGTGRHVRMSRHLAEHGWSASLLVASTVHADGSQAMPGLRLRRVTQELGVPTLWLRATAYGSSMPRRLLGMAVFAGVALVPGMTRGLQRPDVVVGSTVHLLAAWAGARLARRHRVPFVFEIRDVWPESLVHFGRLREGGAIASAMRSLSLRLARRAELVISPLPAMTRYLELHGVETDFLWVSNGVDGEIEPASANEQAGARPFTFMYLGSLNTGNAIDGIIDAFARVRAHRPELAVRLRIVGDGVLRRELQALAHARGVAESVTFEGRIVEREVIARAREADCLVANLRASPLYEFGVSLNKLYMYLAAGRPVVFGNSAANDPIGEVGAGFVVPGGDPEAMAAAMIEAAESEPAALERLGRNGYEAVMARYTYRALAARLARGLDGVVDPEGEAA